MKKLALSLCLTTILTACGGGGGGTTNNTAPPTGQQPTPNCGTTDLNNQLLAYLQDDYLFYQDIPSDLNPADFSTPSALLNAARSTQDQFSFIISEQEFQDIFTNASFFGYGFSNVLAPDNEALIVRYLFDNGSARDIGLKRSDRIITIDGVAVSDIVVDINAGNLTWAEVFGPDEAGTSVEVTWRTNENEELNGTMIKSEIATNTVIATDVLQTAAGDVGYVVFDQFIDRSEQDLNTAFDRFKQENINDLVLDLRYNGGGLVNVANQLSTQIAGNNVDNQVFVNFEFNDKSTNRNSTSFFDLGAGIEQLNLNRVVVLTTGASCSASELVINSLSPFVEVVTVGNTTCGKPVGQLPVQICDQRVFALNFQTTNALGDGDYFNGLTPDCNADDTIAADWGDRADPLLNQGLNFLETGSCDLSSNISDTTNEVVATMDVSLGLRQMKNIF